MITVVNGKTKNILSKVIKLCDSVKVVEVKYNSWYAESYPCQHFGGIELILANGESKHFDCNSVQTGVIMYYYEIDNKHFTKYVTEKGRKQIDSVDEFGNLPQ